MDLQRMPKDVMEDIYYAMEHTSMKICRLFPLIVKI